MNRGFEADFGMFRRERPATRREPATGDPRRAKQFGKDYVLHAGVRLI